MKTFIFVMTKNTKRLYGGRNQTVKVYRVKNNKPNLLGFVNWCTAGHYGKYTEVSNYLRTNKLVGKKETFNLHEIGLT